MSQKPNYSEIIENLENNGAKLEPKSLQEIIDQLKHLSDSAEKRAESCEKAIRVIHEQKKELESDQQDRERQAEQARRIKARKEESNSQKNLKAKKRKDRSETVDNVEIKREGSLYFMKSPLHSSHRRDISPARLARKSAEFPVWHHEDVHERLSSLTNTKITQMNPQRRN